MARSRRGARSSVPADPSAGTGIRLTGPALRLREARAEHDKLLERIAKANRGIADLEEGIRVAEHEAARHTAPLLAEGQRLDEAIHALFEKILGRKRGQKARRRLRDLYRALQGDGVLSARVDPDEDAAAEEADAAPDFFAGDLFGGGRGGPEVEAPTAVRPVDRGALRDLYRRLVAELHPDRVQDAAEQARRTELMKDVTVAFREGDFARLIAMERSLAVSNAGLGDESDAGADELEAKLDIVEETNAGLRGQLREVERQLRALRKTPQGRVVDETLRPGRKRKGGAAPPVNLSARVEHEVAELRRVHGFAERFHAGKVSLDDFVAEVAPPTFGLGFGFADFDTLMGDFFDLFGSEFGFGRSRRRRRRRRK